MLVCVVFLLLVADTQCQANQRRRRGVRRRRSEKKGGERRVGWDRNRATAILQSEGNGRGLVRSLGAAMGDADADANGDEREKTRQGRAGQGEGVLPKTWFQKLRRWRCLYYEVGEAGLWLSDRDAEPGPHCDALLAQGWPRLRGLRVARRFPPSPFVPLPMAPWPPSPPTAQVPAAHCSKPSMTRLAGHGSRERTARLSPPWPPSGCCCCSMLLCCCCQPALPPGLHFFFSGAFQALRSGSAHRPLVGCDRHVRPMLCCVLCAHVCEYVHTFYILNGPTGRCPLVVVAAAGCWLPALAPCSGSLLWLPAV